MIYSSLGDNSDYFSVGLDIGCKYPMSKLKNKNFKIDILKDSKDYSLKVTLKV